MLSNSLNDSAYGTVKTVPRAKKPKKPVESPHLPLGFNLTELARLVAVNRPSPFLGGWTLDMVAAAREAHIAGRFRQSIPLCTKMKTDAAIYSALLNRLAPHRALPRAIKCETEVTGTPANILLEANLTFTTDASSALPPGVLCDDIEHLAMLGLSINQTHWIARPDGSREDAFVNGFPLEAVEWSENDKMLIANAVEGRIPIVHGDGRWSVSSQHADRPWQWGALVPLTNVLSSRPFAVQARGQNANSHGDDKWIGKLPQGVATDSPEGQAMLAQMELLYQIRRVMLIPFGSELKREEAMSQNWQIFKEILDSDNKDAQRILVGQDGTMTNTGGDYIKSWGMFGVRSDIVEADLSTEGTCISTGLLRPWSIINWGRWDRLQYHWVLPDADQDARAESIAKRRAAFWADIKSARDTGFVVDKELVERVAKSYNLDVPTLLEDTKPPKTLASDDPPAIVPHRKPLRPVVGG